jgi:hypothetical protein
MLIRRLTGKSRIESPSDLPFEGLLVQGAGQGPNGFCLFDVFASEEAVEESRSALGRFRRTSGSTSHPALPR